MSINDVNCNENFNLITYVISTNLSLKNNYFHNYFKLVIKIKLTLLNHNDLKIVYKIFIKFYKSKFPVNTKP